MLIGNVGKDPELKHTPSGIPVATFRIATSESWKDKDGSVQEHTDWHNIVAWRGLADVVNRIVKKGTRVYVEGKIRTRKYDDKNNNRKFYVEILADNILLLDYKKYPNTNNNDEFKAFEIPDDEIEVDFYNDGFDSDFADINNKSTNTRTKSYSDNDDSDELLY
jgi:single-strand DNA-binding protein